LTFFFLPLQKTNIIFFKSTRGYDELRPKTIDLIAEKRVYDLTSDKGILPAKTLLNKLHKEMEENGFTETHVHQIDDDIIVVSRQNPHTHSTYHLLCRTAFHNVTQYRHPVSARLPGQIVKTVLSAKVLLLFFALHYSFFLSLFSLYSSLSSLLSTFSSLLSRLPLLSTILWRSIFHFFRVLTLFVPSFVISVIQCSISWSFPRGLESDKWSFEFLDVLYI
jgi:hypothetical protein